jgi:hypothetical protein
VADRALLVLVHSPLLGPASWAAVPQALAARGCDTLVPDLTRTIAGGPPYWPRQVEAVVETLQGRPSVLVGHSGAGSLLPAIGDAADEVDAFVFIDAGVPSAGLSWLESVPAELAAQLRGMAVDGWLPPWSEWWEPSELQALVPDTAARERLAADCPALPLAMFEEPEPPVDGWEKGPSGYLLLSEAYRETAERARATGWPIIDLPTHHLAALTHPESVADALLRLLAVLLPHSS